MAVTIVKKEPVVVDEQVVLDETATIEEQIEAKLNELGTLYAELVPVKKEVSDLQKQYKPLFDAVQEYVDSYSQADDEVTLATDKLAAHFSPHGLVTKVAFPGKTFRMLEAIEPGLGQKLMTFGIADLRKYLSEEQFDEVTTSERSKARTLKIVHLDT
jgi:hypothetical protein